MLRRRFTDSADRTPVSNAPGGPDWWQIASFLFLAGTGLIFIYSTGVQIDTPAASGFFWKQLVWLGVGAGLGITAAGLNYRAAYFRVFSVIFYFFVIGLLILVPLVGVKVYGATRWLDVFGLRIQPSELAKLSLILLLGVMFSTPMFNVNRLRCLLLSLAALGLPFALIAIEPDLGSAVILLPLYLAIVFCAGLKARYILAAAAVAVVLGGTAVICEVFNYRPILRDYQRDRIKIFLNPESDRSGRGHNAYQARLAVGSGGLFGKGIGEGTQNTLGFLPQTVSNNDFIFSVIAEETGFFGCMLLICGYLALLGSIFRTALCAPDAFGRYIAVGIGTVFFTHAFVNIGMSIGLTPITGLSLPFVSYGGSFTAMGMLALGILQSIYRRRHTETAG